MNRFLCFLCLVAVIAALGSSTGCNRQRYRMKADREVYSVLRQGNNDSRWKIDDYRITPNSASRMFDPYCPDSEPMPLDDSAAHQKMHHVAGMNGAADWYEHGCTQEVENPSWRNYLLLNEKGEIPLDREKAIELARLHSPEYQAALENLYLTAMKVSLERFAFDVQFVGKGSINYGLGSDTLKNDVTFGAQRSLATGGQWIAELANSITWSFSGTKKGWEASSGLLNVTLTQPLLRAASRKVVLEELTQTERDFLRAVRQMVLFQQGHYARIVTGSTPQAQDTVAPSGTSRSSLPSVSGGFYGLLAEQIRIENQRQNIIGLEQNLDRFLNLFDANKISDRTQIAETRQNLLSSQSRLLTQINGYQRNIETYVRSLGLPPDLKVSISDPLLEQFQLSSPELTVLRGNVAELLAVIRQKDQSLTEDFRETTRDTVRRTKGEMIILGQDLDILQKSMPERLVSLKNLELLLADRMENGERIDPSIYDTAEFEERVAVLRDKDIPINIARLEAIFIVLDMFVQTEEPKLREHIRNRSFDPSVQDALKQLGLTEAVDTGMQRQQELAEVAEQLETSNEDSDLDATERALREARQRIIEELRRRDEYRDWVRRVFEVYQYELMSLSLLQTRTRLDSMTLVPVSVTAEEAFLAASEHSLDWMNKKSQLVDTWRKIDIAADKFKWLLDLKVTGALGTVDSNRGVRFDANDGKLDINLQWDSPLNRYAEMMAYRSSQIAYQNARRNYYLYVDSVQAELRNTVRNLQMSRVNFEINRNAVLVGTVRVDVTQLRLEQPPQRGGIDTNTARQAIDALTGLMDSQNNLLNTWVEYQTQRMLLDMNMGTMALDDLGRWIDPGMTGSVIATPTLAPEVRPLPLPLEMIGTPQRNRRYVAE